jgi:hypothetical protein
MSEDDFLHGLMADVKASMRRDGCKIIQTGANSRNKNYMINPGAGRNGWLSARSGDV